MDKLYFELKNLVDQLPDDNLNLIKEILPASQPEVDIERIKEELGNNISLITIINWIKSVLKSDNIKKGNRFRTAKNMMLVIYAVINPTVISIFESNKDKSINEIVERQSVSVKIQKNALGYFGTERWNRNLGFWLDVLSNQKSVIGKK